mmetsp:Transcript_33355/g.85517  ORF Transcript_33355/g.85517 Transcript_33355/m.85517 type:complete len:436 (+) Transcript_33355:80-1387(+)
MVLVQSNLPVPLLPRQMARSPRVVDPLHQLQQLRPRPHPRVLPRGLARRLVHKVGLALLGAHRLPPLLHALDRHAAAHGARPGGEVVLGVVVVGVLCLFVLVCPPPRGEALNLERGIVAVVDGPVRARSRPLLIIALLAREDLLVLARKALDRVLGLGRVAPDRPHGAARAGGRTLDRFDRVLEFPDLLGELDHLALELVHRALPASVRLQRVKVGVEVSVGLLGRHLRRAPHAVLLDALGLRVKVLVEGRDRRLPLLAGPMLAAMRAPLPILLVHLGLLLLLPGVPLLLRRLHALILVLGCALLVAVLLRPTVLVPRLGGALASLAPVAVAPAVRRAESRCLGRVPMLERGRGLPLPALLPHGVGALMPHDAVEAVKVGVELRHLGLVRHAPLHRRLQLVQPVLELRLVRPLVQVLDRALPRQPRPEPAPPVAA